MDCYCSYGVAIVFFRLLPLIPVIFFSSFFRRRSEISFLFLGRHSDISVAGGVHSILTMWCSNNPKGFFHLFFYLYSLAGCSLEALSLLYLQPMVSNGFFLAQGWFGRFSRCDAICHVCSIWWLLFSGFGTVLGGLECYISTGRWSMRASLCALSNFCLQNSSSILYLAIAMLQCVQSGIHKARSCGFGHLETWLWFTLRNASKALRDLLMGIED